VGTGYLKQTRLRHGMALSWSSVQLLAQNGLYARLFGIQQASLGWRM
jgi:hypothetical protein